MGRPALGVAAARAAGAPPSHDRRAHRTLALTSLAIVALALRHGGVRLYGPQPVGTATLIAILFTSA